jgi:hypothetical protein
MTELQPVRGPLKDVSGKSLKNGDIVATNFKGYVCELVLAEVIGFSPFKIRLKFGENVFSKFPSQVSLVQVGYDQVVL